MTPAASLVQKIRSREQAVGYWVVLDAPIATERLAGVGYDYVVLDGQHGLLGHSGLLQGLMAADAGGSAGLIRVEANDPTPIGRALDAGAVGVIVPLVDDAEQAASAVAAARYPPHGVRSYGRMRSALRIGPAIPPSSRPSNPPSCEAAAAAGVAAGIHTPDGATAARRLDEGNTFATGSSDLTHLERAAADHLSLAQRRGA